MSIKSTYLLAFFIKKNFLHPLPRILTRRSTGEEKEIFVRLLFGMNYWAVTQPSTLLECRLVHRGWRELSARKLPFINTCRDISRVKHSFNFIFLSEPYAFMRKSGIEPDPSAHEAGVPTLALFPLL